VEIITLTLSRPHTLLCFMTVRYSHTCLSIRVIQNSYLQLTPNQKSVITIQPVTCNYNILLSQIISNKAMTWTVHITTRIWTQKYTPRNVCSFCSSQNMQYIHHADSCFAPSTWKPCHFPVSVNSKLTNYFFHQK